MPNLLSSQSLINVALDRTRTGTTIETRQTQKVFPSNSSGGKQKKKQNGKLPCYSVAFLNANAPLIIFPPQEKPRHAAAAGLQPQHRQAIEEFSPILDNQLHSVH